MLIKRRRGWELPERLATPEALALGRRAVLGSAMAAGIAAPAEAQWNPFGGGKKMPPVALQPLAAKHNDRYVGGRPITPEEDTAHYNNFYEFSETKDLADAAQALPVSPWSLRIEGMVKTPRTIAFEDLMKQVSLEERVYRHRCVEAWSLVVPWIGFPMAELVRLAEPLGSAQYLKFTTLADPKTMPGLHETWYPWPYVEGVTMQEAMNEVAFISVGMYGKTLPPQDGAPIRVTLPWKYGFKSIKSIVKVEFTDKRPMTFWWQIASEEYGFWANVNPDVPHPRWSQARERVIGTDEMVATQIWNGYGEFVASMYADKQNERLFA